SRRQIDEVARKAVDMEAENAADFFAEIVAAFAAGPAFAAGERAIHHDAIACTKAGHAFADRGDFAGRFRPDDERQLALGERHAAPAPHVDVVERDGADANLELAGGGLSRRGDLLQLELAVGNESQRSHRASYRKL